MTEKLIGYRTPKAEPSEADKKRIREALVREYGLSGVPLPKVVKPVSMKNEVFRPIERGLIDDAVRHELVAHQLRKKEIENGRTATAADAKKPSSWLQLARTGTWQGHSMGEFTFDADVFAQICTNFSRSKNGRVPLDFEHASEAGFDGSIAQRGAPAQGWIVELRYNNDMLEGRVEWNIDQPGMQYVRDGAYMFLSPAVIFSSIDRMTAKSIGAELTSAALTNRPFLDGMKPVAAKHTTKEPATMSTAEETTLALPPEFLKKKKKKGATENGAKEDDSDGKPFTASDDDEDEVELSAEGLAKVMSAVASDLRDATTLAAEKVSFEEINKLLCEALNERFGKWSCYVIAVYDDSVVYQKEGDFFSVAYKIKKGVVSIDGTPSEVRRVYKPITATDIQEGDTVMAEKKLNEVLGLKAEASEASTLSAVEGMKSEVVTAKAEVVKLTAVVAAANARIGSFLQAIGLSADAADSEYAKRTTELTAAAAEAKKLEPELTKLRAERAEFDERIMDAEVDYVIKNGNGKPYDYKIDETSRASLKLHRKSDPAGFMLTWKVAMDGMKAGDRPEHATRLTATGGTLAAPPPAVVSPGAHDANENFNKLVEELKLKDPKMSQATAMSQAMRQLQSRAS